MCKCTSWMRLRSAIADLRRQARNPYSRSWLWIPGSLVSLAPRNDNLYSCERLAMLFLRFSLFGGFLRGLLRDFLAFRPRLGKANRDRLLPARDFLAGAAALQSAGLAFLHRAPDFGGCLFRILPCHGHSPNCGKIIFADGDGSAKARPKQDLRFIASEVPTFHLTAGSPVLAFPESSASEPKFNSGHWGRKS